MVRIARLALLVLALPVLPVRAAPPVVVYAHRGGAGLAPENTLGAFRAAHAAFGARGVWLELDVQLAADGVLVVIHDPTLNRTTTNCTGRVVDRTSTELQACDARRGWPSWPAVEPVPRFRDVLIEGRDAGWRIMPEIKNIPGEPNFDPTGERAAAALVADVAATGFDPARAIVQSFFPTSLDQVELRAPQIRTALLTTSQLPGAPPGAGFYATENAAFSRARGYEVVAPDDASPDLSATTVGAIRALGLAVVPWTVDDPARIARAIGWGVDGVISNRPDLVYAALG